ncbi:hypothetical protein FGG08_005781 [Glutinoglossum americanum]|uniref:VLRF1 domain-containing protein n=1 Tax=Glutinoglossum americanum TaxID=1670608 RepID=A0A9P8KVP8_9PEZI|nr:hypothetical protein FGG08_005781 [Glutinoglossum americanum]
MAQAEELLKRPLYVFDLPEEILATLQLKDNEIANQTQVLETRSNDETATPSTSCGLCGVKFSSVQEQRGHVKSDFHGYNLKQKMRGRQPVGEAEFEKLLEDLDESISGSDSDENSEDDVGQNNAHEKGDMLATLLKKQANISVANYQEDAHTRKQERGTGKQPLLWFSTPILPSNTSLGIYRAIFTNAEQEEGNDIISVILNKQHAPIPTSKSSPKDPHTENQQANKSPHYFLCMIGGGHFAAMVVSLSPKSGVKNAFGVEERQASVLAHKTFHRYTTRRKQGGAQSASDAAKGAAHSAGSTLRRYNEVALTNEIRALLAEWKPLIDSAELLFVRATGNSNRKTLYGPYDGQVLQYNDLRIRGFPFNTRRATQAELMRAFVELTRAKVSCIDEAALAAAATAKTGQSTTSIRPNKSSNSSSAMIKASKEEEIAVSHTAQLQSLIRRSKAPAVLSYLSSNSLAPEFLFQPSNNQQNHHTPTPLHFAASTNTPAVVLALLTKLSADPTILNREGKTPFELAGDRATRDAFRVARGELGEKRWGWDKARVPAPLTKSEADKREEKERKDAEKKEAERRKVEVTRLREEQAVAKQKEQQGSSRNGGRSLGLGAAKTGAEKREEEARGMTPEMRMRLERERRARAAEERIRKMRGGGEAT